MSTVLGKTITGYPNEGCTQTFISCVLDTEQEMINCDKYINTKFCRVMLGILKCTQHNPPATWEFVPMQDFTAASDINWNQPLPLIDRQLYRKYGLNEREIEFIERNIEYRGDLPASYGANMKVPAASPERFSIKEIDGKYYVVCATDG